MNTKVFKVFASKAASTVAALTILATPIITSAHGVGATLNFTALGASFTSINLGWNSTSTASPSLDQHNLTIWMCTGVGCTPTTQIYNYASNAFTTANTGLTTGVIKNGTLLVTGLTASQKYGFKIQEKHGGFIIEQVISDVIAQPSTVGGLVVTKTSAGGNGTFNFTGSGSIGSFSITTVGGTGSKTFSGVPEGSYTISEDGYTHFSSDLSACGNGTIAITANATTSCNISNTFHNAAPGAGSGSHTTLEDVAFSDAVSATDTDGDTLAYVLLTGPSHGSLTSPINSVTGAFTYTPTANYNGPDSFTFGSSDGFTSTTGTFSITVSPDNDAPVANNDSASTNEEVAVTTGNVLTNDTDVDGNTLSVSLADVTSANGGTVVNNNDGTFTYTPAANFSGNDTFNYTVSDGNGGTDSAVVTIAVSNTNDAPVAVADTTATSHSFSTNEDVPLNQAAAGVLSNDTDPDAGDTLTPIVDVTTQNGTLTVNPDGSFTYIPNANFNGTDSFTYHVTDGTVDSSVVTATINVAPVNDAPVAQNDSFTTAQNTSHLGVLVASDVDNDTPLVFAVVSPLLHGTFSPAFDGTGSYTYVPALNYNGADSFTYSVTDPSLGVSNTATVTINVTESFENTAALCHDGIDNDNDQAMDYPADTDCVDEDAPVSAYDTNHSHEVVSSPLAAVNLPGSSTDDMSGVASAYMDVYMVGNSEMAYTTPFENVEVGCAAVELEPVASHVAVTLDTPNALATTWTSSWTPTEAGVYCFKVHATDVSGKIENTAVAGPMAIAPTIVVTPPPSVTPPPPPSGGGGGGGGNGPIVGSFGSVLGASTGGLGQVLGESCGVYMDKYLRFGSKKNNADQAMKLQKFLNKNMNASLPVTGFFGPMTTAAVKQFQAAHSDEVLKPWNISSPTGLVYITTLLAINKIECPALTAQLPELIEWSKNNNVQ